MSARTVYLIKRIETEVTQRMNKALATYDVTLAQYIVLDFVYSNPSDFSSAQLSRRFKMTPQSMNEVVTTLQRKELLEKNTASDNKRILRISLTDKGIELLTACNEAVDLVEQTLFNSISSEELSVFRTLIGKVLSTTRIS
ncbi:MAG: MarR family transcriptional regulator [Spirosomataceae bacterium]